MGANIKGDLGLNASQKVQNTITETTDRKGMVITSSATTSTNYALTVETTGGTGTPRTLYIHQNRGNKAVELWKEDTGNSNVMDITNAGGTGTAINIAHSGTGGDIHLTPRAAAGMAAGAEGDIYFNATTHKLMIRGAAGWETVNSA